MAIKNIKFINSARKFSKCEMSIDFFLLFIIDYLSYLPVFYALIINSGDVNLTVSYLLENAFQDSFIF